MKKIAIIILLSILFIECEKKPEKPFIITHKNIYPSGNYRYKYYDTNGTTVGFWEKSDKYNIGDTIK